MLTVHNSRPEAPNVTLFARLDDGSYAAEVMAETSVPYTPYWDDAVDQVMVYIEPEEKELRTIVEALNDGRLDFTRLQDYGSAEGGISSLPL